MNNATCGVQGNGEFFIDAAPTRFGTNGTRALQFRVSLDCKVQRVVQFWKFSILRGDYETPTFQPACALVSVPFTNVR
jgi:hypothetical protein